MKTNFGTSGPCLAPCDTGCSCPESSCRIDVEGLSYQPHLSRRKIYVIRLHLLCLLERNRIEEKKKWKWSSSQSLCVPCPDVGWDCWGRCPPRAARETGPDHSEGLSTSPSTAAREQTLKRVREVTRENGSLEKSSRNRWGHIICRLQQQFDKWNNECRHKDGKVLSSVRKRCDSQKDPRLSSSWHSGVRPDHGHDPPYQPWATVQSHRQGCRWADTRRPLTRSGGILRNQAAAPARGRRIEGRRAILRRRPGRCRRGNRPANNGRKTVAGRRVPVASVRSDLPSPPAARAGTSPC